VLADPSTPAITPADVEAYVNAHPISNFRFGQQDPAAADSFECLAGQAMREQMQRERGQDIALPDDALFCLAVLRGQFGFAAPRRSAPGSKGLTRGFGDLMCPTGYLLADGRIGEVVDQGPWGGTMEPYCSPRNPIPVAPSPAPSPRSGTD
jgi:hypothetical protein